MMKENVKKLLNEQINKELYSAYFYLHMSCYYDEKNLSGFANWFHVQAQEEMSHAMLFLQFLQNNGENVSLTEIKADFPNFNDLKEPLNATFKHEQFVTESIHTIYGAAMEQKDFRTTQFLDWFVKEQGEEEKNAADLIKRFELFGNDSKGLFLLDNELATRTYAPPSLVL